MRRLLATAVLAAALAAPALADTREMSPDEARTFAADALSAGYPQDTLRVAEALLYRDPQDVSALILKAQAAAALMDWPTARDAARAAYGLSDNPAARYRAARLAAAAEANTGHPTRAQFWLRRATADAPDDTAVDGIANDYRYLRRVNPLSFRADVTFAPTSNVNNGSANTTTLVPYILSPGTLIGVTLPRTARALSGYRAGGRVNAAWRLDADDKGRTDLAFGLSQDWAVFSAETQDIIDALPPMARVSARDYDQSGVDLTLSRSQSTGKGALTLRATIGQGWYGHAPLTQNLSISGGHTWQTGTDSINVTIAGDLTRYLSDDVIARTVGLRGGWEHAMPNGDALSLTADLRRTGADTSFRTFDQQRLGLSYSFARPVAGIGLSLSIDRQWRDFGPSFEAPQGRFDNGTVASIQAAIPQIDLYGFHPTVTFEAGRTDSNVGRYETDNIGLSIGFESSF